VNQIRLVVLKTAVCLSILFTQIWAFAQSNQKNQDPNLSEPEPQTSIDDFATPTPAQSRAAGFRGADGVEFQPVPLDTSVNCSSVILKGTRRFQGTAFVMPRLLVSLNKQQETMFEILQTDVDKYLLRFAIYFPRTDEDLDVRIEKSHVQLNGCHFDAVLAELNKGIKEDERKIRTLARIPVSSIDVRIDGIKTPFTVGGAESSMLNYAGSDHVVEFPINSRRELEAIMARIQGDIGLGIHVAVKFSARSADGALFADVDLRALSAGLGAALRGYTTIGVGELSGAIGAELKKMNLNIETEAGSGDVYNMLANRITDIVTSVLLTDAGAPLPAGQGTFQQNYGTNGSVYYPQNGGVYDGYDGTMTDPTGAGGQIFSPSGTINNGRVRRPRPPETNGTLGRVSVAAALDVLRKRSRIRVEYKNSGASEQHVYATSVLFRGEVSDPDVRSINVYSGETLGRVLPNRLVRDNPIALSAVSYIPERIEYVPRTRFFTEKQLRANSLHEKFSILRDEKLKVEDLFLKDGLVGAMKVPPQWNRMNANFYVWGITELFPQTKTLPAQEIELSANALRTVPVVVSFSKVGARKFKLADLLTNNQMWLGKWDDLGGKVILIPKANLGQLTIWNVEPQQKMKVQKRRYFQQIRSPRELLSTQFIDDPMVEVPTTRSIIRMQISEDSQVVGRVTPTGGSNASQSVLIPKPR